jgi:hypothetical protein
MKKNKKAILGMLLAMVMSLGVMDGIGVKSEDSALMNLAYCAYKSSVDENFVTKYQYATSHS